MNNTDKSVDIYERLADALDALPAGFTRTPSRLEMKLIRTGVLARGGPGCQHI